jgi:hypothetical protein
LTLSSILIHIFSKKNVKKIVAYLSQLDSKVVREFKNLCALQHQESLDAFKGAIEDCDEEKRNSLLQQLLEMRPQHEYDYSSADSDDEDKDIEVNISEDEEENEHLERKKKGRRAHTPKEDPKGRQGRSVFVF